MVLVSRFRLKKRAHSGLQINPRVEALGQVFVKILPLERKGYARVVQVLYIKSEGRKI
jgi:hypothetical protein